MQRSQLQLAIRNDENSQALVPLLESQSENRLVKRENSLSDLEQRLRTIERNKNIDKQKRRDKMWSETKDPKDDMTLKAIE